MLLDFREYLRDPGGRPVLRQRWLAALARAVTGEQRVADAREEFNVGRQRLARAARRTAKDPGRANGGEENAVVGRVARQEGLFHFGPARQGGVEEHHEETLTLQPKAPPPENEHGIPSPEPRHGRPASHRIAPANCL